MPEGQVLEFAGLSKRFGPVLAVDGLSARVEPGSVTGFLGPNGAGKTTTLRMLLGLVRASSGEATIGGVPYAKLDNPLQTVGAVLEASSFHPGRTAANHLKVLAQASGLPAARVDQALGTVGLADVAGRKVGGYSLGMRQRLGLAAALLGDPGVLVLDEPVNGLDPEGITWIRGLLQELARQGRTVLMSSHLLSEVQQTVDRLLIISNGRLVFQGGIEDLVDPIEYATVVDAPDRASLSAALESAGVPYEVLRSGLTVRNPDVAAVGRVAADAGVALSLLQRRGPALEEVFFELVNGLRVHPSARGAEEETVDAAAPAITEDEPATPDPEPGTPADVDAPAAAEAVAESEAPTESVAPAEAEAPTEAEAPAETEAVAAPESGVAPSPEPASESASDAQPEPAPHTASFAVAATGVIDIVPPTEPESTRETEPETASEPQSEAEPEPVSEPEPAAEPDPTEPSADRNEVVAGEPEELPPDDWRHEEKTQADRDADAFFHAFDGSSAAAPEAQTDPAEPDAAASDAAGTATPDADESAEDAASRPDDHSHDGGDGR
ncbi:ATP-binding cassette domain-containing protein [Microbacterium horticulturae]|uniref:ATP-binding cassette domain-containing protein n=1 Tax=Microbacterium horticulturae TaxID=3028316 RepID=A0ABY8BVY2_9MICO|nr:ATP-binding cassette domain-containing protein [Microbacterium sp. KACC 23027]WEG08329.1 ATP-binding cassette domain-containing protein [Microbacterium sp. KACC 23027]